MMNMYAEWITPEALIAAFLIFLGSFVQTAIGFGLAIVAAPLLILVSPDYVPAPICLVALFISILNALKHRASVEIGGLKMALIGRVSRLCCGRGAACSSLYRLAGAMAWFTGAVCGCSQLTAISNRAHTGKDGYRRILLWFLWNQFSHRWPANGTAFTAPRGESASGKSVGVFCL